jgi:phage baseplate assembly protein gpV
MFTNIYRAIVSYANADTGEIKVRIPTKFGNDKSVSISKIGRKKQPGWPWPVPEIGEQVVVTADDESFTNVFILNVNPQG